MAGAASFAAALRRYREGVVDDDSGARLLSRLGYGEGDAGALRRVREGMLALAAAADDVFLLNRPDRGALHLLGLRLTPSRLGPDDGADEVVFAGGRGLDLRLAFESCIGEAFERLCLQGRSRPGSGAAGLVRGRLLTSGDEVSVPAHVVYRSVAALRSGLALPGSAGCSAAPTQAEAVRGAVMELIERDAVALWWLGGRRGVAVPEQATAVLRKLRPPSAPRPAWLLELTTDLAIPVVAALSSEPDGSGVVTAAAAGAHLLDAAWRAAAELVQMEHAASLAMAKRDAGHALSAGDRLWVDRLESLSTREFPILLPAAGAPARHDGEPLAAVADADPEACAVDITLEGFGLCAARALAPRLQQCGSAPVTTRLEQVLARSGHDHDRHRAAPRPI